MRAITVSVIALILLLLATGAIPAVGTYTAVPIPHCSWPSAINSRGNVVFQYEGGDAAYPGLFNGKKSRIAGESGYTALGLNNKDLLVGQTLNGGFYSACYWKAKRTVLLSDQISCAMSVNDKEQIVGGIWPNGGPVEPVLWENEQTEFIPHPGFCALAIDINNSGQVLGLYETLDSYFNVFVWDKDNGSRIVLPNGECSAINDTGEIVGSVYETSGCNAARIRTDGTYDTLPDYGVQSWGYDINSQGDVVGDTSDQQGVFYGALWPKSGGIELLDELVPGFHFEACRGINDAGQIIAYGTSNSLFGASSWWLLTPQR